MSTTKRGTTSSAEDAVKNKKPKTKEEIMKALLEEAKWHEEHDDDHGTRWHEDHDDDQGNQQG